MFRSQINLTARELTGLAKFNIFVLKFYVKAWYSCASPVAAPRCDLELLKELYLYKKVNAAIANAALKSLCAHLWYLSESLIGLAFFDPAVPVTMKTKMIASLEKAAPADSPKRIILDQKLIPEKQLHDFVTANTKTFFTSLGISQAFLEKDPSLWESDEAFVSAKCRVSSLKVVNDPAERGIALIQQFNPVLTKQEEQKQYLLQVVEKHRQDFPDSRKSTVLQNY
jgi:hypothetical protein